ncbi:MAG: MBL fold metallo-hydrolase [Oscillospiraceae bacterium]|nr:MBL fold metallo-hydrolase [Oscillospiraceae bacterium]
MEIKQINGLGVCATNCYVVISEKGNAVLIDAPEGKEEILSAIGDATLKKIILTHGHFDHIFSAGEIARETGAEVYIHDKDLIKLSDGKQNLSMTFGFGVMTDFEKVKNAVSVVGGEFIEVDELSFEVLHTPGHTSGSICLVLEDNMFTGDTLFKDSRGRTDLFDADHTDMAMSLRKLRIFKGRYDNYNIYAGHGPNTTLNDERENNVYLRGFDYDDMF